jgi:hypothetical protein
MKNKPTDQTPDKSTSTPEVRFNRRREWRLELPLKIAVEGTLPQGDRFSEETKLENISSTGAYFSLNSSITIGSEISLFINLPSRLTEGKPLKLRLVGEAVRLEKIEQKGKKQGVAIRFHEEFTDEEFRFITEE